MEAKEIVQRAIRYIRDNGWVRRWEDEEGAVCLNGALLKAANGNVNGRDDAANALFRDYPALACAATAALRKVAPGVDRRWTPDDEEDLVGTIIEFNDARDPDEEKEDRADGCRGKGHAIEFLQEMKRQLTKPARSRK